MNQPTSTGTGHVLALALVIVKQAVGAVRVSTLVCL
jgi:hypothetical protein